MPRAPKAPLFELGGQWIATDPGSRFLYRFWTERGTGRTRRASLGTTDLEEAKRRLAEAVVKGAPKTPNAPLSAILLTYFEERTDKLPSKKNARLAGRTLLAFWGAGARASAVTEAKQKEFVEWSIARGHSLGYASRNLSVLSAAFGHSNLDITVIFKTTTMQERWAVQAKAPRKRFVPSDDELARFLGLQPWEPFWRWNVISLLTGARPEAVVDLTPSQRRRDDGMLDLNPEGRAQNKKYRPVVREPRALTAWLDHWETEMRKAKASQLSIPVEDVDIEHDTYSVYASVESVQTAFERIRVKKKVNLPKISAYSHRHKIATVMRKARLPKEEQDMQLGHARPEGYGTYDPDFLAGVADALDAWWIRMDAKVKSRSLFAPAPVETAEVRKLRRA